MIFQRRTQQRRKMFEKCAVGGTPPPTIELNNPRRNRGRNKLLVALAQKANAQSDDMCLFSEEDDSLSLDQYSMPFEQPAFATITSKIVGKEFNSDRRIRRYFT